MKNIKEITISVLIIITFYTVLTSIFKDKSAEAVWQLESASSKATTFSINKVTGEVRFHYYSGGELKTFK